MISLFALTLLMAAPSFEVASVTPCKPGTPEPPGEHMGMVQFIYPGGRFRASATSVKFLIEWAYGIQPYQHTGGPSWLEDERYDIVAKGEGNPTEEQMKLMVQTLLAERFKLTFHRESKEMQVFVISQGKTAPKLTAPAPDEKHSMHIEPKKDTDQKVVSYHVVATRYSLKDLTDTFARQLGRPIVNHTGLDGDFDFAIDLTPDETRPNPLDPATVMSALRDQLLLDLKTQKAPVEILAIDGAERVLAGN